MERITNLAEIEQYLVSISNIFKPKKLPKKVTESIAEAYEKDNLHLIAKIVASHMQVGLKKYALKVVPSGKSFKGPLATIAFRYCPDTFPRYDTREYAWLNPLIRIREHSLTNKDMLTVVLSHEFSHALMYGYHNEFAEQERAVDLLPLFFGFTKEYRYRSYGYLLKHSWKSRRAVYSARAGYLTGEEVDYAIDFVILERFLQKLWILKYFLQKPLRHLLRMYHEYANVVVHEIDSQNPPIAEGF